VLEAEGYDEKPDMLVKATIQSLEALRLDEGQAEKTKAVINTVFKLQAEGKTARAAETKASEQAAKTKDEGAKSKKNPAVEGIAKLAGVMLKNVGKAVVFVLSKPEEKQEKDRKEADSALKTVWPDLQKLADATNKLSKEHLSVKQGAAQLLQSTQVLMQIVGALGGCAPQAGQRQTLEMVFERFEGSVTFLRLACTGKLTDQSSSKLLAAAGKGVDDRLLDVFNCCKRFQVNAQIMQGDKKAWQEATQGLWVAIKGVLETLKHLARMVVQESSKSQVISAIQGAKDMCTTLVKKAEALDSKACQITEVDSQSKILLKDLTILETAVAVAEGEAAEGPAKASALRATARAAIAASLFLSSACSNVVQALPELKNVGARRKVAEPHVDTYLVLLKEAVAAPANAAAHTTLLRKAKDAGEALDALADEAMKAIPIVKRVGNTDNLERRIKEAKGAFGKISAK